MSSRTRLWPILSLSFLLLPLTVHAQTPFPGEEMTLSQRVTLAVEANNLKELQAIGPKAIPALLFLYETGDDQLRLQLAQTFHDLAWQSTEVEHALMGDIRSHSVELRLAVYYALGRVSDNPEVVATLLDILQNDPNPLLRDKAACALAYDQVHLKKPEKVQLYAGLIQALSNPERQVQAVAIQALSILTGETKGFSPVLGADRQQRSIEMWQRWLGELQAEQ
ncbi:MAG TPA: HEAT repeat domain-containing protein [Thermoanaerobaculia bacterium]|nr:HEAT repeat domain-containing protein [Thermoanaerobaculia bacterium]